MSGSFVSPETRERIRGLAVPVALGLGRLGLTPSALTLIGFLGTCLAAVAAARGAWLAAGVLVAAFGVFDLLDGALARATGRTSRLGAFMDSTFDRWGEAVVYVGIIAGCLAADFDIGAFLAAAAMASAFMVSYTRAKAESLGFTAGTGMANVGLATREVRIAILTIGLVIVGAMGGATAVDCGNLFCLDDDWGYGRLPLAVALGLIVVLGTITVIQRILHVRAQSREG